MSIFRISDYTVKKERVSKTKLPTQSKSKRVFCRNCNRQNPNSANVCSQCGVEMKEPRLRKRMK